MIEKLATLALLENLKLELKLRFLVCDTSTCDDFYPGCNAHWLGKIKKYLHKT